MPDEVKWIIQSYVADLTSRSLRKVESEGHACRARRNGMDNPTLRTGRDERVPPRSGSDKEVPPREATLQTRRRDHAKRPRWSWRAPWYRAVV